jgi:hypothetical protein
LRSKSALAEPIDSVAHEEGDRPSTYVLWDTATWGQGYPYNEVVAENNGNNTNVPTGCTATAMAIKMRFHEWPVYGTSDHEYDDHWGDIQFSHYAHFGDHHYNWSALPTGVLSSANQHVADLMYHCGVAVEMNYEEGESGAWPSASSMYYFFRYRGTLELSEDHHDPIMISIIGGLPVVISSSAHTVVACGYRDTEAPYFYMNVGHDGSNDGWHYLSDIPGDDPTIDMSYPYSQPLEYIYVDASAPYGGEGALVIPYNTVQDGYDEVPDNGHLWLKEGSYTGTGNEPITFERPMTVHSYAGTAVIG